MYKRQHEYGPDPVTPKYSYLAGDITKAYSEKVDEVLRSMVFLPLEDSDHPATFIVMDKVTSANEAFQKSWLLHMQEEPQVDGNKIIVKMCIRDRMKSLDIPIWGE